MVATMESKEIRSRFLDFFKKRGHAIIPSASLIPENDPTVLFNTAGMQPIVPFLMGREHPAGSRLANAQKCVRTGDIEEIGDNTHCTFFEMLGNWSLGDYFKDDAIRWSYEFLTSQTEGLGLDPARLYVTVFIGDENAEKDTTTAAIWEELGIPRHRIYYKDASSNWWPAVKGKDTWTGPTGPCSEMFYDVTEHGLGDLTEAEYDAADEAQQVVEVWNDVFMEFEKKNGIIVAPLQKKNVDTGAGLERLCMVIQNKKSVFDTDLFQAIMEAINGAASPEFAGRDMREKRIIADHIRTATFLIADGVIPSNTDQGYVLRRIIRRAVRFADMVGIAPNTFATFAKAVIDTFGFYYTNLEEKAAYIQEEIAKEEKKFRNTLSQGMKELEKMIQKNDGAISGQEAFKLFSSYGFPIDMTIEIAEEKGLTVDHDAFQEEFEKHQALSRQGAEKKFTGGLADHSEQVVKYHTATHLLQQALREVLGTHVAQKGSNITGERLRFDFTHPEKVTDEQKQQVEAIVNQKIAENVPMQQITMDRSAAEEAGALSIPGEQYADTVSVYFVGNTLEDAFSKELCGGPHVTQTGDLGTFTITKEEAVGAGVRRIRATLS